MSLTEIRNVDHAILLCSRMAETRAFYENVMGFPVDVDHPGWVSFRVGATLLTLRPRGRAPVGEDGPAVFGSASVQLAFRVPLQAIDTCHEELLAHGVSILRAPTDLPAWRHRTLFFRDPEGNLIEIYAEY
jgi:glyoxylase I family protein